ARRRGSCRRHGPGADGRSADLVSTRDPSVFRIASRRGTRGMAVWRNSYGAIDNYSTTSHLCQERSPTELASAAQVTEMYWFLAAYRVTVAQTFGGPGTLPPNASQIAFARARSIAAFAASCLTRTVAGFAGRASGAVSFLGSTRSIAIGLESFA